MSVSPPVETPTAEQVERLFHRPSVVALRPLILGGIGTVKLVRRLRWEPHDAERLRSLDPPVIFAANHVSHADTAVILGTLPRPFRERTAVAAALDVFGNGATPGRSFRDRLLPLVVAAGFHAFPFERHGSALRSVRTAAELMRHGWNLLIYPEGTRSRRGVLGPFKSGVGVLAKVTDRPVVPIHVRGGDRILPCGTFMPRPGRVVVYFGEPLWHRSDESSVEFVARLRRRVQDAGRQQV